MPSSTSPVDSDASLQPGFVIVQRSVRQPVSRVPAWIIARGIPPLLALALASACAPPAPLTGAQMNALFAAYTLPGAPGAAVVVVRDSNVAIHTYGLADLATGEAVTAESDFRLASLTKQFTATAVLLLAQDGKLSLDDPITDHIAGLPAYARSVRIRHLLGHTSGIWDYEEFVPDSAPPVHDADVPGLVARAESLYFAPGSRYRYSNSGYALLALAVERASGVPFATFLRERIFTPLGMSGTVAYEAGVSGIPHRAYGHARQGEAWVRSDQSNTSAVLGDGGIYTNASDLSAWVQALWRRPLPGPELQQSAWTPGTLADGSASPYGLGWFVDTDRGHRRLSHHGETRGFTNAVVMYPDLRIAVIVLTNRIGGAPWDLAQRVASAEAGLRGGVRIEPQHTPAREGYVTTTDGARLFYRMTGQGTDTLIAIHGGPGVDLESIAADFAPLAAHHVVIFYDQRGAGRSELPADTMRLAVARQIADLDEVRTHFGLRRVTLVAHSYGPLLAASYALAHPEAVRRMVFFGPVPPWRGDFWRRFGASMAPRLDSAERAQLADASRRLAEPGADVRQACRDLWAINLRPRLAEPARTQSLIRSDLCASDTAGIRYGLTTTNRVVMGFFGDWDLRERLRHLDVPTLIVHGEEEAIPMDMVAEWATSLPHAELVRVPRAAHYAYVERPELVWPAVERFLTAGLAR